MKHLHFALLLILLLAACQTATSTPISPADTLTVPTSISTPKAVSKNTSTPAAPKATPTPTGPVVHSSDSNPNASNLITVSDQFIVNNSLTIDSVTAAQAGWIVLYLQKIGRSGQAQFGPQLVSAPVPAGKSSHLVISLSQNINPSVNLPTLPGTQLDAVLQTDASNPNTMVHNNNQIVDVSFTILTTGKSCVFCSTATAAP